MQTNVIEALQVIAAHGAVRCEDDWLTAQWYEHFLVSLFEQGCFVPPLLLYQLRCAAETRIRSRLFRRRSRSSKSSVTIHDWFREALTPDLGRKAHLRGAGWRKRFDADRATRELARLIGRNLMNRFDISPFRNDGGRLCAKNAVLAEACRLQGGSGSGDEASRVSRLQEIADFLQQVADQESFEQLAPIAELLRIQTGVGIDPFVIRLLRHEPDITSEEVVPHQGSGYDSEQPRRILWHAGEFAKREQGPLPSELERLAPTDLLLATQKDLWWLFLYRAEAGSLLQRFHHSTDFGRTIPTIHLQMDLLDDRFGEIHRLRDAPSYPIISWYRAVLIQTLRLFAGFIKDVGWNVSYSIGVHDTQRWTNVDLDQESGDALACSVEDTLRFLVGSCPEAFAAAPFGYVGERGDATATAKFADVWLRVVLGREFYGQEIYDRVQADLQRAVRLERQRSGTWSLTRCDSCYEVQRVSGGGESFDDEVPTSVAQRILRTLLDAESPADMNSDEWELS